MIATPTTASDSPSLAKAVIDWLDEAQRRVQSDGLTATDLAALAGLVDQAQRAPACGPSAIRQRLLYLHTSSPSVASRVQACQLIEPVPGGANVHLTQTVTFPYNSPHEAILDGWQIVAFPEYRQVVQDREIDVPGYQFILQKMELING